MDHTASDTATTAGPPDATLVTQALDGDRGALGAIYDRYADRVHTMCAHMLGDRDEAADVCAEVFLVAFQRLGQLRERDRLKSWLFAIARHEVFRRTKQRRRIELTGEVDEMDRIAAREEMSEMDERTVDPAQLALVLRDAAHGLDDRDRMVMELQLQGLDGDDLAAALGTSASTAYQHVHRMKERLERSLGAVLVARQGRADCRDLDRLLGDWDGEFSVLWRKRVARHVDGCEVCERRRRAVPGALLGGVAAAAPMVWASSVSAAPASVRDKVLRDARIGTGGTEWSADGFPPADEAEGANGVDDLDGTGTEPAQDRTRPTLAVVAITAVLLALLALLVVAGVVLLRTRRHDGELTAAAAVSDPVSTSTVVTSTTVPGPEVVVELPPEDPGIVASTVVPVPPATGPDGAPELVEPDLETEPPAQVAPPVAPAVQILAAPDVVFHPTPGFPDCGASTEFVVSAPTAGSVALVWQVSGQSGSVALVSQGFEWVGVLEVPAGIVGELEIRAFAIDAAGTPGLSDVQIRPVQDCITPG